MTYNVSGGALNATIPNCVVSKCIGEECSVAHVYQVCNKNTEV